jgi:CBS domain-containing protein
MYVRELMTPRVIAVAPADPLAVARRLLRENRIHHLLVMEKDHVVGLLSYRDLIGHGEDEPVSSVMSRDVLAVEPWATARNAATMMLGRKHGCLPVMEGGHVTGVITTTDLLRAVTAAKPA